MLVEIPDASVMIGMIVVFLVSLVAFYLFFRLKLDMKTHNSSNFELEQRIEFYEKQLIDMKIRLDAYEIGDLQQNSAENLGLEEIQEKIKPKSTKEEDSRMKTEIVDQRPRKTTHQSVKRVPNMGIDDITEYVLGLITSKSMTSRDIQNTLGRSREHISRLMKKMYQDGLVERDESTKPYRYSITVKGQDRLKSEESVLVQNN